MNYPQRSFHLRASPTNPATPVVFAVWSAHDVNFVRFAMLKNIVGFVVIRQNALIPPTPCAATRRREWGNVKGRRFFCRYLLTKYLFPRGYTAQRRIHAVRSCEMRPHICKPIPDAALRRRGLERNRGSSCEDKSDSKIGCHIAQGRLPLF